MIRKKKGTLKEGTPGLEKGRDAKLDSKSMEAAPPDASVETAPDTSVSIPPDKYVGGEISNVSPITGADTFSRKKSSHR